MNKLFDKNDFKMSYFCINDMIKISEHNLQMKRVLARMTDTTAGIKLDAA